MNTTRGIRVLTVLSVSVVLVSAFSWLALGQVSGSIKRIDVFGKLDSRPEKTSKALNYLLVGSDTREGLTKEQMKVLRVGSTKTAAGGRSDTMLLVHISKARDKAMLLNPIKMVNFFNAAISTVKTDSGLNESDLITLAKQMRNLSASKVRTLTVPLGNVNAFEPGVGSVVTWDPVLAPELFQRLRDDLPIVDLVTPSPSASSTDKPKATVIDKFKTRTADENPCGELK
ncbi:MAG: hypothetical protein EBY75_01820 [Actinobacteria bacterium]|nr:hypothetical protein [Actinomycetota bacterium]